MRRLVLTALATAATAALMTPTLNASAEVQIFDDAKGDSGNATDIRSTFIDYGKQLIVVVHYPGSSLEGSILRYYLDTDRSDAGPEYLATVIPNSDGYGLAAVDNWKKPNQGTPVDCPRLRAHADALNGGPKRTNIRIPAGCIDAPDAVRVAVVTKDGASADWARDTRRFLPSVPRF